MGNTFKTAFLLTALTLLLMFIGQLFGGQNGMLIALIIAGVLNFVSYFYSDKLALAMYRALQSPGGDQQAIRLTLIAVVIALCALIGANLLNRWAVARGGR